MATKDSKTKAGPRVGGVDDNKQASPLYQSGRTNGQVGGPKQPPRPADPLKYLSEPGMNAQMGSPGDKPISASHPLAKHNGE